jgi:ribosomal protein L11 methyltransferase
MAPASGPSAARGPPRAILRAVPASSPKTRRPFRVLTPADAGQARDATDLVIEPSAFGGGSHPTTASCLEVLAALAPLDGRRVLDLGSGSGILGIAAVRLGAASALCLDVNPEAVACARRNGLANGVDGRLAHRQGGPGDVAGEAFDLVVANVGGELLLDEARRIAGLARPGGLLLLSGLLQGWALDLERAYLAARCGIVQRRSAAEFCTLVVERR